MDDLYVKALIDATEKTFGMMLGLGVQFGEPTAVAVVPSKAGVSGLIGLGGDVVGTIAISFPTKVAKAVVSAFCGMEVETDSEDFTDAIGELANMVAGATKAEFKDVNVNISCPAVIVGEGHTVQRPSGSSCLCVPCKIDMGVFVVEIALASRAKVSLQKAG